MGEKTCPKCKSVVAEDAATCPNCGAILSSTQFQTPPTTAPPSFANMPPGGPTPGQTGDFASTLIPYHNPDSLWAYYLGLFSIIPCFGLPMGAVAFVKGIKALKFSKAHPEAKGKAHSWVGIGCGSLGFLFNLGIIILVILAIATSKHG